MRRRPWKPLLSPCQAPGTKAPLPLDCPDIPAGRILAYVLIHQLEVEVQVGDRVPANVRTHQIRERVRRDDARADATPRGREQKPPLWPLQLMPPTEPSRSV